MSLGGGHQGTPFSVPTHQNNTLQRIGSTKGSKGVPARDPLVSHNAATAEAPSPGARLTACALPSPPAAAAANLSTPLPSGGGPTGLVGRMLERFFPDYNPSWVRGTIIHYNNINGARLGRAAHGRRSGWRASC
jgi:hypothetical protein